MAYLARCCALLLTLFGACAAAAQPAAPVSSGEIDRIREELGIGRFKAPSIDTVFDHLAALEPLSFDNLWRPLPDRLPSDRPRMAMLAGGLIADGFLVVESQRRSKIEPVGHGLVRLAKGLGIAERLTKRARHVTELAEHEKWPDIRKELMKTQAEAEAALLNLKDEDLVHLVALGGWLRGLEITSGAIADSYTPDRATRVFRPELADVFINRIHDFQPHLRTNALIRELEKDLEEIRDTLPKRDRDRSKPLSLSDVKSIHDSARDANRLIAGED